MKVSNLWQTSRPKVEENNKQNEKKILRAEKKQNDLKENINNLTVKIDNHDRLIDELRNEKGNNISRRKKESHWWRPKNIKKSKKRMDFE